LESTGTLYVIDGTTSGPPPPDFKIVRAPAIWLTLLWSMHHARLASLSVAALIIS
jgi:hypothetical protein